MRKKSEILARVSRRREEIQIKPEGVPPSFLSMYQEVVKAELRVLKWALGRKIPDFYWCVTCQKSHRNLRCPHCGDDTLFLKGG